MGSWWGFQSRWDLPRTFGWVDVQGAEGVGSCDMVRWSLLSDYLVGLGERKMQQEAGEGLFKDRQAGTLWFSRRSVHASWVSRTTVTLNHDPDFGIPCALGHANSDSLEPVASRFWRLRDLVTEPLSYSSGLGLYFMSGPNNGLVPEQRTWL